MSGAATAFTAANFDGSAFHHRDSSFTLSPRFSSSDGLSPTDRDVYLLAALESADLDDQETPEPPFEVAWDQDSQPTSTQIRQLNDQPLSEQSNSPAVDGDSEGIPEHVFAELFEEGDGEQQSSVQRASPETFHKVARQTRLSSPAHEATQAVASSTAQVNNQPRDQAFLTQPAADRAPTQVIDVDEQMTNNTIAQPPAGKSAEHSTQSPKQTWQETTSPQGTSASSPKKAKMGPSAAMVQQFNDKDEATGRPRLQQSWIDYTARVFEKDYAHEIWHPELQGKIMADLQRPVSINNFYVARHTAYRNFTRFVKGEKTPYNELDIWAIFFRNENGLPDIWASGINSDQAYLFSDVINAAVGNESYESVKAAYKKTRGLKGITYFKPSRSAGQHKVNPTTPKKRKMEVESDQSDSEVECLEIISTKKPKLDKSDVADGSYDAGGARGSIQDSKIGKRTKDAAGGKNTAVKNQELKENKKAGGNNLSQKKLHGDSDAEAESDTESVTSDGTIVKKPESDTDNDEDDDGLDDDEPVDSWILEMKAKMEEPEEETEEKPKFTVKEKVNQRDAFFKTLGTVPPEFQDKVFRTIMLDVIQDMAIDPNEKLAKQVKPFKKLIKMEGKKK
ncbi:hypothetical protein GCG54_00013978 [Colletotrichum gloeosporioides]|uniref:Uncharacterized protein n=1 Tax=Colletotrichum gloeosporioides TaxID=474922 RepID=A0A8H4FJ03_COLGL|nr:uncharacterized protein GCG54_00013978 [Colletotrichum gloeosporioides]KAF3802744.1 hypothetical protein GCG54_00013978 [Colletotrichum gloeosporioides]